MEEQGNERLSINDYNTIPVFYCKQCLSLKIRDIPILEDSDYCDDCGSTNIEKCSIEEWEALYKSRYGHRFLDRDIKLKD